MSKFLFNVVLAIVVVQAFQHQQAQQITMEFLPEKQVYLVGEPIFVLLDIKNGGSHAVWMTRSCAWDDTRFEASSALKPFPEISLFGCYGGIVGSCASSRTEILPGAHYRRRYLLDGAFRLDSPGKYPIHAWHKVEIYAQESEPGNRGAIALEINSSFELNLVPTTDADLASAYKSVLRDLHNPDAFISSLAVSALIQHPPPSLEYAILSLADNPQTAAPSVSGLQRLATPRAKAKLAELSAVGSPEDIRQMAIPALAVLDDSAYCSSMLNIAQESSQYSRFLALRAAGYLCGEKALSFLKGLLPSADPVPRFEIAHALGNSHTREAVPILISLLLDANSDVRRAVVDSLANLTHRSSGSGVDDQGAAKQTYNEWIDWWTSKETSAEIYGIEDCSKAMLLH